MADMDSKLIVSEWKEANLLAGEVIKVQVFNPNGTVKTTLYEASCPEQKNFSGRVNLSGEIVSQ